MKILVDECVPRQIKRFLADHNASTVTELGLSGKKNGELINYAEGKFDLLITSDRNMRYQQNLKTRTIAIIELSTNDRNTILASESKIREAIRSVQSNNYIEVFLQEVQ